MYGGSDGYLAIITLKKKITKKNSIALKIIFLVRLEYSALLTTKVSMAVLSLLYLVFLPFRFELNK